MHTNDHELFFKKRCSDAVRCAMEVLSVLDSPIATVQRMEY